MTDVLGFIMSRVSVNTSVFISKMASGAQGIYLSYLQCSRYAWSLLLVFVDMVVVGCNLVYYWEGSTLLLSFLFLFRSLVRIHGTGLVLVRRLVMP